MSGPWVSVRQDELCRGGPGRLHGLIVPGSPPSSSLLPMTVCPRFGHEQLYDKVLVLCQAAQAPAEHCMQSFLSTRVSPHAASPQYNILIMSSLFGQNEGIMPVVNVPSTFHYMCPG